MNRRITGRVLAVFLAVVAVVSSSPASAAETQTQRAQRMAWWREARFGMFIHWGLYSIAAGHFAGQDIKTISSWTLYESEKPLATYTPLIEQFNPVDFDPNAWVSLAKEAGMKYMVLTSKHHEGFCLFDSAYTDFDVMSSPFKRDILKELVAAARRQGMRIGWYYSILDWNHPDYLPRRKGDERPTEGANFERYLEYMRKQLDEVLGNYGPIDVIWFDGEWDNTWNRELGWEFYRWIRQRYPNVIINNRIGGGRTGMSGMDRDDNFAGDFGTPEQEIPPGGLGDVDWETCMTMNDTWGFKRQDSNWKSTPVLVRMLIDCASKGGNLLLNVGPTARAVIPQPSVERLRQMSRDHSPFRPDPFYESKQTVQI